MTSSFYLSSSFQKDKLSVSYPSRYFTLSYRLLAEIYRLRDLVQSGPGLTHSAAPSSALQGGVESAAQGQP